MLEPPALGVIGGSGLYSLLDNSEEVVVETPYGSTSDLLTVGDLGGCRTAFIPRHGRHHELPPHLVPYRANLWALEHVGVRRVIAPAASGSLQPGIRPGDIVICDQLVDRTAGRPDTFSEPGSVIHVSMADPYCGSMRRLAHVAAEMLDIRTHAQGTVAVIQGPRFSTRAESRWFASAGWSVVNMTQYPEAALARELGLCYLNLSVVTDMDAGDPDDPAAAAVDARTVLEVLSDGMGDAKRLMGAIAGRLADLAPCECSAIAARGRI
ncbi:MAG TPA: S-methyl-5'-thioadenosine phosphorylase [Candidatus Dormibacteraeota bacterium]|nr:S-methyl-5'-thioadenosine phosphorylase [Candidatus Dormibacteraeota bacterium]